MDVVGCRAKTAQDPETAKNGMNPRRFAFSITAMEGNPG